MDLRRSTGLAPPSSGLGDQERPWLRRIIEPHRLLPGGWVTLGDVYRCTIDSALFARKILETRELAARLCPVRAAVASSDLATRTEALEDWAWKPVPGAQTATCLLDRGLRDLLEELDIVYETEESGHGARGELREQVDAIERRYRNDWVVLDARLRTSIVEGDPPHSDYDSDVGVGLLDTLVASPSGTHYHMTNFMTI